MQEEATDLLAFGALMRPLGAARAKSEYMRAIVAFCRYCGQPITISNMLDTASLTSNVDDRQLRLGEQFDTTFSVKIMHLPVLYSVGSMTLTVTCLST